MREILFKAKRIDNGEWVEGNYVHTNSGREMICDGTVYIGINRPCMIDIDASTICQYTGLTDKNGNKIWENDIVDTHNRGVGYSRLEKVIYENGGFFPISTHGWECEPDADEIEVIGNVFDNKELLERD